MYKVTTELVVESFIEELHVSVVFWRLEGSVGIIPELLFLVPLQQDFLHAWWRDSIEYKQRLYSQVSIPVTGSFTEDFVFFDVPGF